MIKAVFFDMDGTLLPLDMREYLPRHRADLAKKVFPALDPGRADKAQLDTLLTLLDQGDGRHHVYVACLPDEKGIRQVIDCSHEVVYHGRNREG